MIGASILDLFNLCEFTKEEIKEILENEILNFIFILGRTIGLIGHYNDQKRLKQGLFRMDTEDITYLED